MFYVWWKKLYDNDQTDRLIILRQLNQPGVLMNADDENVIASVKNEVKGFMQQFPLYPELG